MIVKRPARERGKTETHWLESFHTFSFNRYYDPRYTGFRDLVVINEDYVAPGRGFATHSHSDMEIITYVVRGRLAHKDSTGTHSEITPGEVQRMSAGTGVSHSEFNPSDTEPTHLLQIWIQPDERGLKPGYEQLRFSDEERRGRLRLVASPGGVDGSVTIHQDTLLYDGLVAPSDEITHQISPDRHAWIQVIKGEVTANGTTLQAGDGAAVSEESSLSIRAAEESEILLFDLA